MDVVRIARHWFPHVCSFEIEAWEPGFSGGRVFRVRPQSNPHRFALKVADQASASRWPITQERIARACNASASDASACATLAGSLLATPCRSVDGAWTVADDRRVWQCCRWIDGRGCQEDEAADPTIATNFLLLGAAAIAKVHAQCGVLPPPASEPSEPASAQPAPRCITDRVERLRDLQTMLAKPDALAARLPESTMQWEDALRQSLPGSDDNHQLAASMVFATQLIRKNGFQTNRRLLARLAVSAKDAGQLQSGWVLRDVHREHVLFDPSRSVVTGVIDHDAMDWDCRVADLARWAGSFPVALDKTSRRWHLAVQGYQDQATAQNKISDPIEPLADLWTQRPFSTQVPHFDLTKAEITLGETLLEVNAWVGLVNWIDWIGARRQIFLTSSARLFNRISGLIDSVSQFC